MSRGTLSVEISDGVLLVLQWSGDGWRFCSWATSVAKPAVSLPIADTDRERVFRRFTEAVEYFREHYGEEIQRLTRHHPIDTRR